VSADINEILCMVTPESLSFGGYLGRPYHKTAPGLLFLSLYCGYGTRGRTNIVLLCARPTSFALQEVRQLLANRGTKCPVGTSRLVERRAATMGGLLPPLMHIALRV
jgi:hypothetical protein